MRRNKALTIATGMLLATGLSGFLAPVSSAAEIQRTAPGFKGVHVQRMSGLVDGKPANVQYRLDISALHRGAAAGTQQWRSCEGIEATCRQGSDEGSGWSNPEKILLVKTPAGIWAGTAANGNLSLRITKAGKFDASYLGKWRPVKQTRDLRANISTMAVSSSDDEDCESESGIYTCYGFIPGT